MGGGIYMKKFFLIAIAICICTTGFSANYGIIPCKMEDQNEFLFQGKTLLVSQKQHKVLLYPKNKILKNGNCGFYLGCLNNGKVPINLYFQNLSVTDQWGRPIRVLKKEAMIAKKGTETCWNQCMFALGCGLLSYSAQEMGCINFLQVQLTSEAIERERDYKKYKSIVNSWYFDSNTLFPNVLYESVFQISIPKGIENQLEHLFVNLDVDGERHTFCFYYTNQSKSKRR